MSEQTDHMAHWKDIGKTPEGLRMWAEEIMHNRELRAGYCKCVLLSAADTLESALNPWIKCSDRLPEDGEEVIVWSPDMGLSLARKEWEQGSKPNHWAVQHIDRRWELEHVTHWMPTQIPPGESR